MHMTPYRDSIRVAIFEKIINAEADISQVQKRIVEIIKQYGERYPNFEEKEKINLELTVPIKLPPGGKKGDCKAVVTLVETEFIKLSGDINGGATIQFGEGSWLDKQKNLVSDECLIVYTAMPLANWVDCISVLKKLIKEVQSKLKQRCVFLRIDNQTYGDPINLLGKVADAFPGNSEFGGIDKACITLPAEEYQERSIISVSSEVTQTAIGNTNIQISSGGSSNVALGPGSITSGGDIVYNITVDHERYEEIFTKNILLERKLAQLKQEDDEEKQKEIAEQASILAEQMRTEDKVEFTVVKLLELGNASMTAGRLEIAEGQFKQALRQSKKDYDKLGQADSINNLGLIADIRGDYYEAMRLHNASLVIKQEIGDREGEAQTLNNLGLVSSNIGDLHEAARLYKSGLTISQEIGYPEGEIHPLNNLGLIAYKRGDYDEAERLIRLSLTISQEIGHREGEAHSLNNLGLIVYDRGDYDEAERLFEASLAIEQQSGHRLEEANCLVNLARIAHTREDDNEAEHLYKSSLTIFQKIGNRLGEAQCLNNLGILTYDRGDFDEAERLIRLSLTISLEIKFRSCEVQCLNNLGLIAYNRGDYDEAERLYKSGLTISQEIGFRDFEFTSLNNLANIADIRGDNDTAERLFAASDAIRLELGLPIEGDNEDDND